MLDYVWLIPAFPALGVLVNGFLGYRYIRHRAGYVAVAATGLSLLVTLALAAEVVFGGLRGRLTLWSWVAAGSFEAEVSFLVDPLSTVMLLVVTGVGFLIHIYSVGYMRGDPGYPRFFCYLNLFMVAMLVLVLADNYLLMFVGWEGVGLCSYLLIGYWYERKSASNAGNKAFIVNRIGDAGFLLGLFLMWTTFGTLEFASVFPQAGEVAPALVTAVAVLLFVGAVGKSAQVPLYVWLPDAMEGPTPVSALIHAATMVTAGVYMVARSSPLYVHAPSAMYLVAVVGALTAIFSASIALVQNDIKRVLAYSTVSQLGYMFLACGVGAFAVGIFHLFTHAFFKALLFLCAGSVIHALHHAPLAQRQDMRYMGGLGPHMPVTVVTFWVGALAIAGIPPLAGFWSKDEILAEAFKGGRYLLWMLGVVAALMTAFYMFRLIYLTFYGEMRVDPHARPHIHESPRVMTVPLVALAFFAAVVGVAVGFPPEGGWIHRFLSESVASVPGHGAEGGARLVLAAVGAGEVRGFSVLDGFLMALSVAVGVAGFVLARHLYVVRPELPGRLAERFQALYRLLFQKYWVDELYDYLVVRNVFRLMSFSREFDTRVVDGAVNGSGIITLVTSRLSGLFDLQTVDGAVNGLSVVIRGGAQVLRFVQTGMVQNYVFVMLAGIFALVSLYLFR